MWETQNIEYLSRCNVSWVTFTLAHPSADTTVKRWAMFESPPGYLASQWLAYLTAVWGTRPGHGSIPHQDDIKVVTANVKDPLLHL